MSLPPPDPLLVRFVLNDEQRSLAVQPDATLLDTLRHDLGMTGTKEVCNMGNCGACTVLLDDQAVYSCLVLAAECDTQTVDTVEGLADGQEPSAIQQAFVDCDALQCGFCTPGQIMSLEGLRRAVESPDGDDIERAVQGNLCRCGAYRHILEAANQALRPGHGPQQVQQEARR